MANTSNASILASLRLSKAMALARRGKWRDAEVAITDGNTEMTDPVALHAVAALVTSEGDYVRALKLWEQLQRIDPSNEEARRMVPAIELWLSRPGWAPYFPYIAGTVVAVFLGLFLYFTLSGPAYVPVQHAPRGAITSPVTNTASGSAIASGSQGSAAVETTAAAPTPIPVVSFPVAPPAHRKKH
jgi:hypothetical protein